jgi:WD40 repeat protein
MDKLALWQITLDDYIISAAWSAQDDTVFVGTGSGKLYAVEVQSGKIIYEVTAHKNGLLSLAYSPQSQLVATGGQDGFCNFYDAKTGKLLHQHSFGRAWVEHLQAAPDGYHFLAGGGKSIVLFDAKGQVVWQYDDHKNTVAHIDWAKNSRVFITSNYGTIHIFDVMRDTPTETLQYATSLISLKWSPNLRFIAAGTQDAKIHFWELPYEPQTDLEMSGYTSKVKTLSWSADSVYLASNCDNHIIVWNTSGAGPAGTQPIQVRRHVGKVTQLAYRKTRNELLSGGEDALVVLWQPAQTKSPLYVGMTTAEVSCLTWSRNDQKALIGTAQGDVEIWDFSVL